MDLTGLIDPHLHSSPDSVPRLLDDIELAAQAVAAGMRGILLKNHTSPTAARARIAARVVSGIQVWGGVVLNRAVGGFNPAAVEAAAACGGREVWMPTIDAAHHRRAHGQDGQGMALDEPGSGPAIREVLAVIAQHDLILGTGHLSVPEILALVGMARQAKVRKILVTHPEAPMTNMPLGMQRELASQGCRFERVWVFTTPALGRIQRPEEVIAGIREIGIETTVLATDMGQVGNPPPVEGLRAFADACLAAGFSEAQVRRMGAANIADWLA